MDRGLHTMKQSLCDAVRRYAARIFSEHARDHLPNVVVYDVVGEREQVPRQVAVDENHGLVVLEEVLVLVETDRQEVKQVPETLTERRY